MASEYFKGEKVELQFSAGTPNAELNGTLGIVSSRKTSKKDGQEVYYIDVGEAKPMRVRGFNLRRPGTGRLPKGDNFESSDAPPVPYAEVDSLIDEAIAAPLPGSSNTPRDRDVKRKSKTEKRKSKPESKRQKSNRESNRPRQSNQPTTRSESFNLAHLNKTATTKKRKKKTKKRRKSTKGRSKSTGNKTEEKIERLRDQIDEKRKQLTADGTILHNVFNAKVKKSSNANYKYKTNYVKRREYEGHASKVLNVAWGSDSNHFISISPALSGGSAGKATQSKFSGTRVSMRATSLPIVDLERQGGQIIVWDGLGRQANTMIPAESPWLKDAQFSQSMKLIVSGGADDVCTVTSVAWDGQSCLTAKKAVLEDHEGTVTSCIFLDDDNTVVSSSNDCSIILWDVAKCMSTLRLMDHEYEVNSIHSYPENKNTLVSASQDGLCNVWDVRSGKVVQSFDCGTDVNYAKWFPDGKAVLAALDNNEVRMYDVRSSCVLGTYKRSGYADSGALRVAPAPSGKHFACLYDVEEAPYVTIFDTMTGNIIEHLNSEDKITCIEISPDGKALLTGSASAAVSVWA